MRPNVHVGMMTREQFEARLPPAYEKPVLEPTQTSPHGAPDTTTVSPKEAFGSHLGRTKKCTKCKEIRPVTDFPKHDTTKDGFAAYCKFCRNALNKKRREENFAARLKHHFATRIERQLAQANIPLPDRYVERLEEFVGYSFVELAESLDADIHLRENISAAQALGRGYHVDHRKPLVSFDIKAAGDEAFRACWAISNLELVPAAVNLAKGTSEVEHEDVFLTNTD